MSNEIKTEDFIKALFAKNEALFGDARMEVTPEDKPVDPPADPPAPEATPEDKPEEKPSQDDDLPEWARKELTSVRAEAANYRTRLREAEGKLSAAKTPEEVEAAVAELRTQNANLERSILVSKVANKHGLPQDLADVLKGADEAELEAHAKVLKKFAAAAKAEPESLGGGLDPSTEDDGELDPRKLARHSRR